MVNYVIAEYSIKELGKESKRIIEKQSKVNELLY